MSEVDWQKTRIDVYKELFKMVVALTVAIAAGIASMVMLNQFGLLFWATIAVFVMVLVSVFSFQILLKEVDKLKDMSDGIICDYFGSSLSCCSIHLRRLQTLSLAIGRV